MAQVARPGVRSWPIQGAANASGADHRALYRRSREARCALWREARAGGHARAQTASVQDARHADGRSREASRVSFVLSRPCTEWTEQRVSRVSRNVLRLRAGIRALARE